MILVSVQRYFFFEIHFEPLAKTIFGLFYEYISVVRCFGIEKLRSLTAVKRKADRPGTCMLFYKYTFSRRGQNEATKSETANLCCFFGTVFYQSILSAKEN